VKQQFASANLTNSTSKRFIIKIQRSGVWWAFDAAVFPVYAPMQLGIEQISLNSFAVCSHSSEVGTFIYIGCSTFHMAFPDSRTMPCTAFFPTRKKHPEDANDSPVTRKLKEGFFLRLPEIYGQVTQRNK